MSLWKKQKEIEGAVEEYLAETEKCFGAFSQAFDIYLAEGLSDNFERKIEQTHAHEARADDKRREIEQAMYERALIPESRGDILGMLEALDLVPNKCESVLYQIWFQDMSVPSEYGQELKKLVRVNRESYEALCQAVRHVFADVEKVMDAVGQVDQKESESDRIERNLIKSIFDAPGDKAEKILLKELILEIGAISDRAENAADRVRIIAIKRRV